MIRQVSIICLAIPSAVLALALIGGYLGAVHPLGDSLAMVRPFGAAALAVIGLLMIPLRAWRGAALALSIALTAGLPVLAMALPGAEPEAAPQVTIYVKNMLFGRGDTPALVEDIQESGADVVLLQELNSNRGVVLEALAESHPHRHICDSSEWSGIAILSRWPLSEPHCSNHRTLATAQVAGPHGPFWAVSTHLQWPYPFDQRHALDHELAHLRGLEGAVVIAGDFNMAPWGQSVRDMAEAVGADRLGALYVTIRPRGVPLAIDHVLATGEGTTERRPRLGSDHYGLVAQVVF